MSKLEEGDKLAAAALAAARCGARGAHGVDEYFTEYLAFEGRFLERREAERESRGRETAAAFIGANSRRS